MAKILLCVSASAALYKACDLASQLTQAGHEVPVLLTPSAAQLVSAQQFEAVTGQPARVTELSEERLGAMDHISFARGLSAVVVAPCTAALAGRIAMGLATDLVTTTLMAVPLGVPRLVCPAMNPHMLAQPAVARNLTQMVEDGWERMEPEVGHMACGEDGPGRLADPDLIVQRLQEILSA
jgi:phosphopantothenoylcysteine decarboxylase/phosphopantothenate--cysteine ligase